MLRIARLSGPSNWRYSLGGYGHPGAGDGNRTRVACLEGRSSTIELHRRIVAPGRNVAASRSGTSRFPGQEGKKKKRRGPAFAGGVPAGFEPASCGVDNAVFRHRFRFLRLHRSTAELRDHGAGSVSGYSRRARLSEPSTERKEGNMRRGMVNPAWSRWSESNRRPAGYKSAALPLSYSGVLFMVIGSREGGGSAFLISPWSTASIANMWDKPDSNRRHNFL